MGLDDKPGVGQGGLSPDVERFLRPRETPRLGAAVLSAIKASVIASLAGAVVVAYSQQNGLGEFLLAARVIALRLVGSATLVDSSLGLGVILLSGVACGIVCGALFGVVIARLIGNVGAVTAVGVGVIYGVLVWIFGQFVLIASIAPNAVILGNQHVLLAAHIVYGAILGLLSGWSREAPAQPTTTFRLHRLRG